MRVNFRPSLATMALLVDQPMGGPAAVPGAGLPWFVTALVSIARSQRLQVHLKSNTLEVNMSDRPLTIGEPARRASLEAHNAWMTHSSRRYLKAIRSLRSFEGRSAFGSWLHRIVYNACMDQLPAPRERQPAASARRGQQDTRSDARPRGRGRAAPRPGCHPGLAMVRSVSGSDGREFRFLGGRLCLDLTATAKGVNAGLSSPGSRWMIK